MAKEISASRIILSALESIIKLLEDLKINYALMGGLVLSVWGRERATKDIDIIITAAEEGIENLMRFLRNLPFKIRSPLKRLGDSLLIFVTYEDRLTGFPVNVDLFIAQTEFQKESLRRAKAIEVLDRKLRVITPEDLILYKLLSPRPIDIVDAQVLLEENIKDIDRDYLKNWAKKLKIIKKLNNLLKRNA